MSYWSKHKREVKVSFMIIALITMTVPVFASLGLAVRFPDIVLEQVNPGLILNFRQDKNIPYVLINQSDAAVDVAVEAEPATKGNVKEGYEPALRADWVKVVPTRIHLEKGDAATADVILSVPNDPALVGRHFQMNLHAHTVGGGFLAVGVMNYIRFSVGTMGPQALKKEAALKILSNLDLDLTPQSVKAEGVPLGRAVALKDFKAGPLKITNRGEETLRLRLESVTVENTLKHPDYDAGDPKWLTVKPVVLKVKSNRIEEAALMVKIPDVPENRGRKFMFVVRAELDKMDISLAVTSRIYVETAGEPVKAKKE